MPMVECPSGLKGELRGLTVAEEDLILQFSSGGKRKSEEAFKELLRRCWLRTTDVGPYPNMDAEKPLNVDDLLVGDTFYLLLQMRLISYGNELDVRGECSQGHGWDATIDLSGIEVYPLSDESKERYARGEPCETVLPVTGRTVKFRLLHYADESAALRNLKKGADDIASETLRVRIVEISGFNQEIQIDEDTGMDMRTFIRALPVADSMALREAMEDEDCGVETEYESVCDVCDARSMVSIQEAVNFFGHRRGRRKRGSRRSRT